MSQGFAVFLLMNNYFHDVATAMLLACCIVLWTIRKNLGEERDDALMRYAAALYRGITAIFWFSVLWIIVSGIVRIATVQSFEWPNFAQKRHEAGLIAKYCIAVVMMALGMRWWFALSRAIRSRPRP